MVLLDNIDEIYKRGVKDNVVFINRSILTPLVYSKEPTKMKHLYDSMIEVKKVFEMITFSLI